jgi:hypothetical protein
LAFPDLTFRSLLAAVPDVLKELNQLCALFHGYLSAEHDDEGSHTNINALSVTSEGDVLAEGNGTFAGEVSAIDGTVRLMTAIESGVSDGSGGPALVIGADGDDDRVALYAESAGANDYVKLSHGTTTPVMIRRTATDIYFQPGPVTNASYTLNLGGDLSADAMWDKARIVDVFHTHNGTVANGKWQDYVPAWTNVTVGNGTVTARWTRVFGKTIKGYVRFVLGNTSAITGGVSVSLPVTAHASMAATNVRVGYGTYLDDSTGSRYWGAPIIGTATTLVLCDHANPYAQITGAIPFAWTTSDVLYVFFEVEEA